MPLESILTNKLEENPLEDVLNPTDFRLRQYSYLICKGLVKFCFAQDKKDYEISSFKSNLL
jgi:hypothetical protein